MRKLLFILLALPLFGAAKEPIGEDILARTLDPESPYYYPNLMLRYNAADSTLTAEDYHYLYYGYAYQDSYKPLAANPDLDRTLMIVARINPEKPLREDIEALISTATDAQKRDPFSPKLLNMMAFAYGALGDTINEKRYFDRTEMITRTIRESGDGLTQKTPQHILMFDHALDVLAAQELTYGKSRVISRTVEFVPLTIPTEIDGKKTKGYYFDFSRVYWNKPEGYTYKRDRTWQFNNLKPREYK